MSNYCRMSSESEDVSRSSCDRCDRNGRDYRNDRNNRSGRDGRIATASEAYGRRRDDCDSQDNISVRNHNHEFSADTAYAKDDECVNHNHSINGVTGRAIRYGRTHVHKVESYVTTEQEHFHEICDTTGPAIYFSDGKHIHLIKGTTTSEDGHKHEYYFVAQVEDPSEVPERRYC